MTSLESRLSKRLVSWMPFFHAVAAGFFSMLAVGSFGGLLLLMELNGPIDFRWLLLAVSICLFISAYTSPAKTILGSGMCGLLFALPIVLSCFLISLDDGHHHAEQVHFVGIATFIASPLIMVFVGRLRRSSSQSDNAA